LEKLGNFQKKGVGKIFVVNYTKKKAEKERWPTRVKHEKREGTA